MKSSLALPALSLLTLALAAQPGMAQEVGAAGAVNPAARGTPPSRPTRVIELGAKVIHKERIQTTGGGSVQLIFIDKSTLNIGPNSDIVIDEFIYDPSRGAGRMAVSMAKGVLRFVGGNISHAGGASVKTPVATIGIRRGRPFASDRADRRAGGRRGAERGGDALHHGAPIPEHGGRRDRSAARSGAAGVFALATSPDPALSSPIPYVAGTVVASGAVQVSPVYGYRREGTESDPTPQARTLQVAIGIDGAGASQSSNFMVSTGSFSARPDGNLVFRGGFGSSSEGERRRCPPTRAAPSPRRAS